MVNPSAKRKELLFDREQIASQLTEIVQDPFEARQLPIAELKAGEDGRTFTFKVVSKADSTFYFSYDYPSRKLTHLKDKRWNWISRIGLLYRPMASVYLCQGLRFVLYEHR